MSNVRLAICGHAGDVVFLRVQRRESKRKIASYQTQLPMMSTKAEVR